jgi:hypothetical protein
MLSVPDFLVPDFLVPDFLVPDFLSDTYRRPFVSLRRVTIAAMFGKKVKEYVRFERWILILIVVVFALRLGLSLAGLSFPVRADKGISAIWPSVSNNKTEWVSINLVLLVGLLYCAIAVQTTGFGTYKHLFPLLLLQITIAHWLIGMGIILGIVTGHAAIAVASLVLILGILLRS